MSTLSVSLPDKIYEQAERLAQREGVSMDRFIVMAIERMALQYLEERARRGSREAYEAALAKVPDVEPEEYDKLPE